MSATRPPSSHEDERGELARALPAYEIGEVLGRGSFAVVYSARHIRLDRDVAIKRLSPDLLGDAEAGKRFAAEARALALLDHPHVVRIYDYVERDDVYALIMERVHGGTLAERLRLGSVPRVRGCAFAVATLHGLEHAHQHGILHRDIKPANLLFAAHDLVKVADFGIAKVVGPGAARMTTTGMMLGTPAFMAPEQASRSVGAITAATDVWAVGTMLYELLCGQMPFATGDELIEVLHRRVSEDPRPLATVAPDIPHEIAGVVMHALARDPDERWQTAGAFAEALEAAADAAFAGGLRTTDVPIHRTSPRPAGAELSAVAETMPADLIAPSVSPEPAGTPMPIAASNRSPRRQPLRPRLGVRTGVAIAAIIGAAAIVIATTSGGPGPEPAVTDRTTGPTTTANIVRNGGFETPNIGASDFEVFNAGDRIGPWEVGSGQVDIVRHAFETAAGKQSLDINGLKQGSLLADLPTRDGARYVLAFRYAANPDGSDKAKMVVRFGGKTVERLEAQSTQTAQNPGYENTRVEVTASSSRSRLEFDSESRGYFGMVIDDVSLREVR